MLGLKHADGAYRDLLAIAFPAMLESLFTVLVSTIDTQMVSPLGTQAISGVAVTAQPKLMFFSVFFALGTTVTILVSQAKGAKDRYSANASLSYILKLTVIAGLVLGAAAALFAQPIMVICSNQSDTMDLSVTFFQVLMAPVVFQALVIVMNAALRGMGNTKVTLLSNVALGIVDVICNYLFIEGHFGFPALGVAGAALATVLGTIAALCVSSYFLFSEKRFLSLVYCVREKVRLGAEQARDARSKAVNTFLENILTRIGFLLSGIIVARLGSYETSIYAVGMQLLNYSFAFGDGMQAAVIAKVGESAGAHDRERTAVYVKKGVRVGLAIAIFAAIVYVTCSGPFYSLFSDDADFIAAGAIVGLFVAAIVPFQVIRIIRMSAIRGLGDTKTPRNVATICVLLLNPTLSFALALVAGLGQWGVWIASLITQIVWFILTLLASRKTEKRYFERAEKPEEEQGQGD